jgi:hypothetical protein
VSHQPNVGAVSAGVSRPLRVDELGLPDAAAHVVTAIASVLAANHRRHRGPTVAYDPVTAALPGFVRIVSAACVNLEGRAAAPVTLAAAAAVVRQPMVLAEVHRLLIDEEFFVERRRSRRLAR